MLKDAEMTVPKNRETSAVYMQQERGWGHATRVTPPYIAFIMGLHMLLLSETAISALALCIFFMFFCFMVATTVEPPKKGHFGNGTFVLSSEVVLLSEVH